jgi:hypothetical protein
LFLLQKSQLRLLMYHAQCSPLAQEALYLITPCLR